MTLGEAIWPVVLSVEVVDFAFQRPDEDLLYAFLLAILKLAGLCEAYRIQNFEQSGETSRVAIVWGGYQKQIVLKQRVISLSAFTSWLSSPKGEGSKLWASSTMRRSHGN